jgi:hypothetical protein
MGLLQDVYGNKAVNHAGYQTSRLYGKGAFFYNAQELYGGNALLAFGVSCFVQVFGAMGLIPAVLLFGIPALLWAPGFLIFGVACLRWSLQNVGRAEPLLACDFRSGMCAAGLFLMMCVIFECGLLPSLLSAAARILE